MTKSEIEALMKRAMACSALIPEFKIPLSKDLILSLITSLKRDRILVIGSNVHKAIVSDEAFRHLLDPETRHDKLMEGYCATFLGTPVYTDTFYHPDDRIVPVDTMYMASWNKEDDLFMKTFGLTITTKE